MPQLLLVEDDAKLARSIREYLEDNEHRVNVVARGDIAVEAICQQQPDLVILDIMLPGLDGLAVCRQVRPRYQGPILMLTARGEQLDEIIGLEVGADDYIAKPVAPRLLLARIRALLRRLYLPSAALTRVDIAGLAIDVSRRTVHLQGRELEVSSTEFDLLWYLATRAGETVTREELYRELRGVDYDGLDRSIDLRVSRLRTKLDDDPKRPRRIKAVRGVGYILVKG